MLCQLAKPLWRYRHFSTFQDGDRPPPWIFKLEFLAFGTSHGANMRHHAKFRADWSNQWGKYSHFPILKMAVIRNLRFVKHLFGPPIKSINGGLCHCAKLSWNWCSSFHIMQVVIVYT